MSYEIRADYAQKLMFPPSVEDWVPADHPARFLREVVDSLDLEELGFSARKSSDGRPSYAADLMVKVWLYGYINAVRSPRKLERACREHVSLIWLTGNNAPDHNSIWRFWRDNPKALRKLFKAVSRIALRAGLIELVLHAVDGTKVVAQASRSGTWTKKRLQEQLAILDTAIEEFSQGVDRAGASEETGIGYRLPAQWKQAVVRREQLRELLGVLETEDRAQIHQLEREARLAKTRSAGTTLTHNAQAVVDSKNGLIVAEDVIGENTDNHALTHMIEVVQDNLGGPAAETLGDGGYYSGDELERAEAKGFCVLVKEQKDEPKDADKAAFHHTRFTYDEARDCCICPRGKELHFERQSVNVTRGIEGRTYRCKSFRDCPVRAQCSSDPRGRTLRIPPHHQAIVRQREKQHRVEMKRLMARRGAIVEPIFGIIKEVMGFRRFTVAGLENVRTQWSLICTAYNLRKLCVNWSTGALQI